MKESSSPSRSLEILREPCSCAQQPCDDSNPSTCCASKACGCANMDARAPLVQTGLGLEYLTIGWEVVEATIALIAALHAGSVALLGFGIDSVAELASALILVWRLKTEQRGYPLAHIETIDRRARQMVGASLFVLAAYIAFDAVSAFLWTAKPAPSVAGMVLTAVAMVVMLWLGRAKRRTATELESGALFSDAFQATACFWLCLITLAGLGLNLAFGWWWADPAAALVMVYFIGREGRSAWRGDECSCC